MNWPFLIIKIKKKVNSLSTKIVTITVKKSTVENVLVGKYKKYSSLLLDNSSGTVAS